MSWTPEREQKLKELWKKGHSASQIASMLGDTTRNAVIGKAHRLNLEARATSKKSTLKEKTQLSRFNFLFDKLRHILFGNYIFFLGILRLECIKNMQITVRKFF